MRFATPCLKPHMNQSSSYYLTYYSVEYSNRATSNYFFITLSSKLSFFANNLVCFFNKRAVLLTSWLHWLICPLWEIAPLGDIKHETDILPPQAVTFCCPQSLCCVNSDPCAARLTCLWRGGDLNLTGTSLRTPGMVLLQRGRTILQRDWQYYKGEAQHTILQREAQCTILEWEEQHKI